MPEKCAIPPSGLAASVIQTVISAGKSACNSGQASFTESLVQAAEDRRVPRHASDANHIQRVIPAVPFVTKHAPKIIGRQSHLRIVTIPTQFVDRLYWLSC